MPIPTEECPSYQAMKAAEAAFLIAHAANANDALAKRDAWIVLLQQTCDEAGVVSDL